MKFLSRRARLLPLLLALGLLSLSIGPVAHAQHVLGGPHDPLVPEGTPTTPTQETDAGLLLGTPNTQGVHAGGAQLIVAVNNPTDHAQSTWLHGWRVDYSGSVFCDGYLGKVRDLQPGDTRVVSLELPLDVSCGDDPTTGAARWAEKVGVSAEAIPHDPLPAAKVAALVFGEPEGMFSTDIIMDAVQVDVTNTDDRAHTFWVAASIADGVRAWGTAGPMGFRNGQSMFSLPVHSSGDVPKPLLVEASDRAAHWGGFVKDLEPGETRTLTIQAAGDVYGLPIEAYVYDIVS